MKNIIDKRYEFVVLFDVENGNPNGDPDAGNMPRIDPETGHGLVSDVCLKRKIRNYVDIAKQGETGFDIYVREGAVLNEQHMKAYKAHDLTPEDKKLPKDEKDAKAVTEFMCKNFYDIRAFGAVMTTKVNCGQVRGPVQINFAKSIDPIVPLEVSITRMAVTDIKDKEKTLVADDSNNESSANHTMGRKHIIPYSLYKAEGYISAHFAKKVTGFNQEDLELLWNAIINMFEHDHSAARGKMATRKLIIFEHDSALGSAPAHKLFECVNIQRKDMLKPARSYSDYTITIDFDKLPSGVKLIEKL